MTDFLKVDGRSFKWGATTGIRLRGVHSYQNSNHMNWNSIPDEIESQYIGVDDVAAITDLGLNSFVWPFSYSDVVAFPDEFHAALGEAIAACHKFKALLWLKCMTLPNVPGKTQKAGGLDAYEGYATSYTPFWANEAGSFQKMRDLWKGLATTYKDEPAIAGYIFINEPVPGSELRVRDYWNLVRDIAADVRTVDTNHIVTSTPAGSYPGLPSAQYHRAVLGGDGDWIDDPNYCQAAHLYDPLPYTHASPADTAGTTHTPTGGWPGWYKSWYGEKYFDYAGYKTFLQNERGDLEDFSTGGHWNCPKPNGVPVIIDEFGVCRNPGRATHINDAITAYEKLGYSWYLHTWRDWPQGTIAESLRFGVHSGTHKGDFASTDTAVETVLRNKAQGSWHPPF